MESSRNVSIIQNREREREIGEKPEAFIHFRWERSGKNFRLLDSKKIGYLLCGLEIAVINLSVKESNTKN